MLPGLFICVQNYRYWRTYGGNDLLLWIVGGASAVLLAVWVLVTRLLVPATLDTHVLALLTLSRSGLFSAQPRRNSSVRRSIFKGMDAQHLEEIIFVEVKSGSARLNHNEHSLKHAIDNKRVRWQVPRALSPYPFSRDH